MQLSIPAGTSKKPISFGCTNFSADLSAGAGAGIPVRVRRTTAEQPWSYRELDFAQRALAGEIRDGQTEGAILLNELEPVITTGKRTGPGDLIWSE